MSRSATTTQAESPMTDFVLSKNTAAIQIFTGSGGRIRLGTLVQLPGGAIVELTGDGFDKHTKRIAWEGSSFYIFVEPDEMATPHWARAQSAG